MNSHGVAAALDRLDPVDVVAMADGSVDHHRTVHDAGGRVRSRERFGERVAAGDRSFRLREHRRSPGGQAVNAALQCHALGDDVTLYGFVDDEFPFETVRLGDPARVSVLEFDDGDLMLAAASEAHRRLDVETLREAGAFDADPDALVVANDVSVPAVPEVLRAHAAAPPPVTVVDPGPVTGIDRERAADLADALRVVEGAVLSANGAELDALCATLPVADLDALRERCGTRAVVCHETDAATAVTADGRHEVENIAVDDPVTTVGGGDRFSGALARALAADWTWKRALALGNACASYHVATGETATSEDLRASLG